MPDYKELLKRYEQEKLNGMVNHASHSVRILFIEWLEQQATEHSVHSDELYDIVERKFPCQSCGATNTIRVPIARR